MPDSSVTTPRSFGDIEQAIKAAVYTPIAGLRASAWVTPEPVPFAKRRHGRKLAREAGTDAGQPEQRPALRTDDAALAAQIDQQHGLLAGSGRRHGSSVAGSVTRASVQRPSSSGSRITGIRLWIEATRSLGAVVMMVHVAGAPA